ncbi:MAG: Tex family protein [Cytophagales bacterium]
MENFIKIISSELNIPVKNVSSTVELLDGGATVPFISRYRKEMTGSLDEVQIAQIRDRIEELRELEKRRTAILKSIQEQGKLSPELEKSINEAQTMVQLEDLYLPFKPKRKTKASIAREKGLEPLAMLILEQKEFNLDVETEKYINAELGVNNSDEALSGARDIIAETVAENKEVREKMRHLFWENGILVSRVINGKETEGQKFKDYFEWNEPLKTVPSHRLLAMRRGEKEGFLTLDIEIDNESAITDIENKVITAKSNNNIAKEIKKAIADAYKRLLKPGIETDIRLKGKEIADSDAIKVFAENAKELLMAPPLGRKTVLALDPGFRTGCKLVVLDPQGKLLEDSTIYPNEPQKKTTEAGNIIRSLVEKHGVKAIAIGNGTAGRETESFVKSLKLENVITLIVNESGASIYSASDVAREEFPDKDVTVRGAVSIGRRLMDPLAELVKIDPKSIGVGQYQHDVDQTKLQKALDDVVVNSVNAVGVELNTASKQLLTYVSGLGPVLAQNIIDFRNQHGAFKSRNDLKKVPRLGEKAFEQAAAFLRINNAENPLDSSAVHPERYELVEKMAKDLNSSVSELMNSDQLRKQLKLEKYATTEVGLPTLKDIMEELSKPGRDPRKKFENIEFAEGVNSIEDLKIGMKLTGIVTNVTNFGAFVDIGVHQDGLVHISQITDKFIQSAAEVLKVQQKVEVTVMEVDIARKRISLSMKGEGQKQKNVAKNVKIEESVGDLQDQLAKLKAKFK